MATFEAQEKISETPKYYCRECRLWSEASECPNCGEATIPFMMPPDFPQCIAGVWDPEDGVFRIINWDDIRFIIYGINELKEKLEAIEKNLGLT